MYTMQQQGGSVAGRKKTNSEFFGWCGARGRRKEGVGRCINACQRSLPFLAEDLQQSVHTLPALSLGKNERKTRFAGGNCTASFFTGTTCCLTRHVSVLSSIGSVYSEYVRQACARSGGHFAATLQHATTTNAAAAAGRETRIVVLSKEIDAAAGRWDLLTSYDELHQCCVINYDIKDYAFPQSWQLIYSCSVKHSHANTTTTSNQWQFKGTQPGIRGGAALRRSPTRGNTAAAAAVVSQEAWRLRHCCPPPAAACVPLMPVHHTYGTLYYSHT